MKRIKPDTMDFDELVGEIESGLIKIPAFQRDFVWPINDVVLLLDSIYSGYPIGSFLFWESKEILQSIRNIGNLTLPDVPEGRSTKYILDGQQRITSLYAAIKEATIENKKYLVYFDLDEKKFVRDTDKENNDEERYVSLAKILDKMNHLTVFNKITSEQRRQTFNEVYQNFTSYPFSIIKVTDQPIEVVCDIFERVNTQGKKLTVVDLMVAKTYDSKFNLKEKLGEFQEKLDTINYGEIQDISILQSVASILVKGCRRKDILELKKAQFIDNWNDSIKAVELAIDFLRNALRIKLSKILPFSVTIVPLAYFYYQNDFNSPTSDQTKQLSSWFWRANIANRYDSAVEGKIAEDLKEIDKILDDKTASFNYPITMDLDKIISQDYSLRNAFCMTIMCLYSYKNPENFKDGTPVEISSNFSKYNASEMHHIFPKGFLKNSGNGIANRDSIANICFVPSKLNKWIKDNPPKEYFDELKKSNPNLERTLQSHLIGDLSEFGINDNNFEKFLTARANAIKNELIKLATYE